MNYNILFVWLAFAAVISKSTRSAFLTTENGYEQLKATKNFAFLTFLPIIIFVCTSTWRYWGDYSGYLANYRSFPTNPTMALSHIMAQKDSRLFYAFTYLVKVLSGGSVLAYRLALAVLQSLPFIYLYRKYSPNYVFSVYLFVATANPIGWMLNGVRQLVAACIIYAATPLIVEKKFFKVILVILFASLFHQTAVLMIPIVFIAQGEAWNWKTNLAIVGAVILAVIFARFSGATDVMLQAAGYDTKNLVGDDGTHPLRVLVSFVPVLLAWMYRRQIKQDNSAAINVFVNMSIVSFGIYLIAMVTSGILVGRVPLYTSLYSFILLPYLIPRLFSRSTAKLVSWITVFFYFLYYYVQYM